jgi:DNA-directed RNA polymerase specialized sigma24 family protein
MNENDIIEIEKQARMLCRSWHIQEEDIEDYIQEAYVIALEHEKQCKEERVKEIERALDRKRGKERTRRNKERLRNKMF